MKGQQMPQRVDRHVQLGAAVTLGTVISSPGSAFRGGAQSAAVEDGGTRLGGAAGCQAQHGPQVIHKRFEAARRHPTLCLLVDGRPGRQVIRHRPPGNAVADHIAQPIEQLA